APQGFVVLRCCPKAEGRLSRTVVEESAAVAHDSSSAIPVSFPLRVILALVIVGAIAGVGVSGVSAVLQAKRLTESQRMIGVGALVFVMALLAAWVIFLWPAYWD